MSAGEILRKLGILPNLGGYRYLEYGFRLVKEDPERMAYVTKELYPEIAKKYNTSWLGVEHAIRTAVTSCWLRGNREFLNELAGYPLREKPTASEFIAIVAEYMKEAGD